MTLLKSRWLAAFILGSEIVVASLPSHAVAQSCADNTSPTESCEALQIYENNLSISIKSGLTLSGGDAIVVQSDSTGLDLVIQSGATVTFNSVHSVRNFGEITSIVNLGYLPHGFKEGGIYNQGVIGVLSNLQGSVEPLNYRGYLPVNYNIIISSASNYGKLKTPGGYGATIFGISPLSAGSSVVRSTAYTSVLEFVAGSQLGLADGEVSLTGTSNDYGFTLTESSPGSRLWDLLVTGYFGPPTGPSLENTQASLDVTLRTLQRTYALQNAVLGNSLSHDCAVFSDKNICITVGALQTTAQAADGSNQLSGLLVAAHQWTQNLRVGAFMDQSSSGSAGGPVHLDHKTPLLGLFAVWSERQDGTGSEVKVSGASSQTKATVNRAIVGLGGSASEAGSGGAYFNSQGVQLMAKHGFDVASKLIVSPYAGIRHTQNTMGGYTEASTSEVTAPLSYGTLKTTATTVLAGLGASYRFAYQAMAFASAGMETDVKVSNGNYCAAGVSGLVPVNFNDNPVKHRATVSLGGYYDVAKNQRLGVMVIYRQEAWRAVSTTAVMATYTVGL